MILRQFLGTLSVADLRTMAQLHGLQLPAAAWKETLIDFLVRRLATPAGIDATLQQLKPEQRAALDDLIAAGGQMVARTFARDHGAIRYQTPYSYGVTRPVDEPASPADALAVRGLIFRAIGTIDRSSGEIVAIADDVLAVLPRVGRRSFNEILTTAAAPAAVAPQPDLMRDIGTFLCYLQRETVRPVHVDRLAKRDLLKLNQEFSIGFQGLETVRVEGDIPYFEFVHYVAHLLGLIKVQGSVITPSPIAEEWLGQSLDHQLGEAWRRFLKDGSWDDVKDGVARQFVNTYPGAQHVVSSRNRLAEALKSCPAGVWLSLSSLSEALRVHVPSLLRTGDQMTTWGTWSASAFYGSWQDVEGGYISHAAATWLNWFGVLSVDGDELPAKPTVIRISERGAVLLGQQKGPIAGPEPEPIVVQANFEIVVPAETPASIVFRLQRFATLTKRDRASLYMLSATAVWQSLQAGQDIEGIISFLERAGQRPLAQNVAYSLREWSSKHGEITIEPAVLLQTSSDALLAQLRSSKKLALRVKETLSPRAVTIEGDVPALVEQLRKAGFWPKAAEELASTHSVRDTQSSISIRPSDLVHLLVGAIALAHIAENEGWQSPVNSTTIRSLSWNLPPALVKQVDRLATQAIARFDSTLEDSEDDVEDGGEQFGEREDT